MRHEFYRTGMERKEIVPRVPRLSEVLIAATFAPNRNIDESIKKIDLGSLVYEAQLLRDKTANDPKHRESSKLILITNDIKISGRQNEVVIEREPRLGDLLRAPWSLNILAVEDVQQRNGLLKKQRQDKFIATSLHAHDSESPPSPTDLINILKDDIEDPSANTCCFVAGPDLNHVVFRSLQTPQFSKNECTKLREALKISWRGKTQELKKLSGLFRSEEKLLELEVALRQEFFNSIINHFGFIVFTGRADSRMVSRVTS